VTPGALVIGYGNVLRSDDGVGWHVAERLDNDPRFDGVTVLQRHQLTPELSLDVSRADLVVLVDASQGHPAGTFTIERVSAVEHSTTTWSHRMEPATLVGLAQELYGHSPEVHLVSVGVASLDVGDRLSPALEAAVPRVVDAMAELLAARIGQHLVADGSRA